jgi:hypothetical protein
MKGVDYEILQDIITDHNLCVVQREEILKVINSLIPYKLTYKNGFANCKCGCEFESEGYAGEEICPECGQVVWVGGYNKDKTLTNILNFKTK